MKSKSVVTCPGVGADSERLGAGATAAGDRGTAVGSLAHATGDDSVAVGYGATASDDGGIAVGSEALSTNGGIAIGRLAIANAAGVIVFGSGSFPYTELYLGNGVQNSPGASARVNASGGVGSNTAGGDLKLAGGRGTGTAAGGSVILQTAPAGSSGSTLNALVDRVRVTPEGNVGIGVIPFSNTKIMTNVNTDMNFIVFEQGGAVTFTAITDAGSSTKFRLVGNPLELSGDGSTTMVTINSSVDMTMFDGLKMALGTTTGMKIGTGTSQKLGFWAATPVVQQVLATGAGRTVDDVIGLLQTLGLCRQS